MKNIYQRVNDVLGEGKALEKGGKMSGAGGNYSFHRTDDVLAMLRPLLVAHGIHFGYTVSEHVVTTVEKPGKNDVRIERETVKKVTCELVNVDDPNDRIVGDEYGYGLDGQDKGPGKATSYAIKTWLLNTFKLRGQPDENKLADYDGTIDRKTTNELLELIAKTNSDAEQIAKLAKAKNISEIKISDSGIIFDLLNKKLEKMTPEEK